MSLLQNIASGLRGLFQKEQVDREIDEELSDFLEMAAEEKMKQGLSREEALRSVRLERGNVGAAKDEIHAAKWESFLETCWQDVRFGVRMLRKNPGFTAVVVLTLALGIGANTAIFSLLNAVLLQSIPVHDPQELVVLRWSAHARPKTDGHSSYGDCKSTRWEASFASSCSFSYPLLRRIRKESHVFSGVAGFAGPEQLNLSGNGQASMASGEGVSGDFFQTLGVSASVGRTLDLNDDKPGAEAVAVLSYPYWQSAFGGRADAIKKTIKLNGLPFTIVGVADPRFTRLAPGKTQDLWVPLSQANALRGRGGLEKTDIWWVTVVGRIAPGVSLAQAQTSTSLMFRNEVVSGSLLKATDDPQVTLTPAQKGLSGLRSWAEEPLFLLMGAVAILLLIACANVAGLLLSRAESRRKGIAVRLAMGAGRIRIARQLLTESLLLSFAGAAVGILLSFWGATALASFAVANRDSTMYLNATPDLTVLLFTIGIAVVTGILFGLVPALIGTRVDLAPVLKEGSASVTNAIARSRRRIGPGGALVVVQVALSIVVLAGAGLVVRSLANLKGVDPGFDTNNVLQFGVDPALTGSYKEADVPTLHSELQRRLTYLPGVVSVSYSSDTFLSGGLWTSDVKIEGRADKSLVEVQMMAVGPDFFTTMRIPVVSGRVLDSADIASSHDVAVVNRAFANKYFESRDPRGLHFGGEDSKAKKFEIVGIVGDTRYDDLRNAPEPTAFVPLRKSGAHFAVRTVSNPVALIPAVRRTLSDLDNNLPMFDIRTQNERIDKMLFTERLIAYLASLFGLVAMILACMGLYGLLSYEVARRTKEIGIRTALGAQKKDVLRLVVGQGLALVAIGISFGVVGSFGVTRYLTSLLYGVQSTDAHTFLMVCALLLLVGGVASLIPARHATRVAPMIALRYE
jgi:macrolide transport system ATP-binding/permease protein